MYFQQNLRRSLSFSTFMLFLLPVSSQSLQVKYNFMYISKNSSSKGTFRGHFNRNLAKFQKEMLALLGVFCNNHCSSYIETSQLLCSANQMTGFYMSGTLVVKGLNHTITIFLWILIIILTHFMPLISFYTPWKQKISGFLMVVGGIEKDQWHEMG